MNQHELCPECGNAITVRWKRCSCGWRKPETQVPVEVDHGCYYQFQGRRCRLAGSISRSTHANRTWYCIGHYRSLGNPKEGEEWFHYVEKHYDEIMAEHEDWREKLYRNY